MNLYQNLPHMHKKILLEVERLKRQGILKLGRPHKDPEVQSFEYESMLFKKALDALPAADRKQWKQQVTAVNADLIISGHKLATSQRIANRKNKTNKWRLPKELQERNQAQMKARQNRISAIQNAIEQMKLSGEKVTAKTVLKKIQIIYADFNSIQIDTIRKDIAKLKKAACL